MGRAWPQGQVLGPQLGALASFLCSSPHHWAVLQAGGPYMVWEFCQAWVLILTPDLGKSLKALSLSCSSTKWKAHLSSQVIHHVASMSPSLVLGIMLSSLRVISVHPHNSAWEEASVFNLHFQVGESKIQGGKVTGPRPHSK